MGFSLRLLFILGFTVFAVAKESVDLPKNFECVGWLVGLQTLHQDENQEFNEKQISTLEDLYELDLRSLIGTTHHQYFYELVKQIQFIKPKINSQKLVYYFEDYSAVEFIDQYLKTAIRSSWGLETVNEQVEAALQGHRHKIETMFRYAKFSTIASILFALTHWAGTQYLNFEYSTLIAMEKIAPLFAISIIVPYAQGLLDNSRYKKIRAYLQETTENRAVELAKGFNLDLFSQYVGDAISEPSEESWAETMQVKDIHFQYLRNGILTISYGRKEGKPFLLLGVEFRTGD